MVAKTKVQFITSSNLGASTLPNSWGALINPLDDALVNGLNLPAVSSVVANGSVFDITFASNHQVKLGQIIQLSGFVPDELNRKWRVIGVSNDLTISIDRVDSIAAVTTLGTARLPPLGYAKEFSDSGKAVYRNANALAEHRPFLRVDCSKPSNWLDSYAKVARVGVMTECTDINDTSSGYVLPYDNSNPSRNWESTGSGTSATTFWAKWFYSDSVLHSSGGNHASSIAGNKKWTIIGDEEAFYLIVQNNSNEYSKQVYGFGVYDQLKHTAYPYFLGATISDATSDATVGTTSTRYRNNGFAPWRSFMGYQSYGTTSLLNGSGISQALMFSESGTTTTTETFFGKHNPGIAQNAFIPQYVMSGGIRGRFKHIMHALWNPNTNTHAQVGVYDGEMFLLEPAMFVSHNDNTVVTHTMPFHLGSI